MGTDCVRGAWISGAFLGAVMSSAVMRSAVMRSAVMRSAVLLSAVCLVSRAEGQDRSEPLVLLVHGASPAGGERTAEQLIRSSELRPDATAPAGPLRWVSVKGNLIAEGNPSPAGGIRLRADKAGTYQLPLRAGERKVYAVDMFAQRDKRRLNPRSDWLALSRELPVELALTERSRKDEEAFELFVRGPVEALPSRVDLSSSDENGEVVDTLRSVGLVSRPCPDAGDEALACASTGPLRLGVDVIERNHPAVAARSLRAVVGGEVAVFGGAGLRMHFRVGGPSGLSGEEPGRYRLKVRARLVRTFRGGPPPVGSSDEEAVSIVRSEIFAAAGMWGQCGVTVGAKSELDVALVDPPPLSQLTLGSGRGLPAAGGEIAFLLDGSPLRLRLSAGQSPASAASALGAALRSRGYGARVFRNAMTGGSALASFDVLVEPRGGRRAQIAPLSGARLSSDPNLAVTSEVLDLAGGLEHFTDDDAAAGTLQERLLLRALTDEDPSTIDLIVVPVFDGVGRIGESFIFDFGSSLQNALILDRTGIRAGSRSFTLAHELGHILLELPGHPDDFGVDQPSLLMDADAADPTIFGPRRLSLADCQRALRQSGPDAPIPLLFAHPLSGGAAAEER